MMNSKKHFLLFFSILLCGLFLFSCTKEEEETESDSMEGDVYFTHPTYVSVNEVITMTLEGITYPDNPSYKWYLNDIVDDTLRARTVTVCFPDSLAQYTISVYAQKEGFYQCGSIFYMTTVDTVGSRSLVGIKESEKVFFDERDAQWYKYVTIGKLDWFAQNLAYSGAGVAFENSPVMDSFFGRFYHWDEATGGVSATGLANGPQGVCPEGWRIPTNEDWEDLGKTIIKDESLTFFDDWKGVAANTSADAYFNDTTRLWTFHPDNDHNNSSGWNALPVGYSQHDHVSFDGFQDYGFWWSATEKNSEMAYYRYQHKELTTFPVNFTSKTGLGASIRCVRLAVQ